MQTLAPQRARAGIGRSPVLDVLLAVAIGLVAALAKRHLDFHLGVPGHAGVGWISVLTAGALVNPRRGMAVLAGASMAVWGVPLGLGHSLGYHAALYAGAAGALEAAVALRLPIRRWWGAAAAGVIVHVAKYAFIIGNAWVSGIVRRFEVFGILAALRNHVVFGLAGGLLGWAAVAVGRRAVRRRRSGP